MPQDTRSPVDVWASLNRRYLDTALDRLRLLLHRKVVWLRSIWEDDPLAGYEGTVVSDARADRALFAPSDDAEHAFYRKDERANEITGDLQRVRQALTRQKKEMQEAGLVPALELLGQMFGLTTFECDVLLLCLAPELDASFQKLYAYVQDDPSKSHATPQLAIQLFTGTTVDTDRGAGLSREDVWNSFTPQAPLRRFRLIQMSSDQASEITRSIRPIHLDERVAAYLRGENRIDERASIVLGEVSPVPAPPVHDELIEKLVSTLSSRLEQGIRPAVHLKGSETAGKMAVAQVVSDRLNLDLYRLAIGQLPSSRAERRGMLRLLEREAVLLQTAFYVNAPATGAADESSEAIIEEVLDELDVTLFIGAGSFSRGERTIYEAELMKPDPSAQRKLWSRVLGEAELRLNGRVADIAQQFDFGPEHMVKAVAAARNRAQMEGTDGEIAPDDLWQACRNQARGKMDDLARPIAPTYGWEDIVLPDDTYDQLREIAAQVGRRSRVYDEWGFQDRLSRGLGISALFAGPSGTGKTMAAEILAHDLELDLYRIDLASIVSKYIGETEKNLKKVFDAAERSGAILFFDEADALFGKRTEVSESHDRYANIEIDYLLQRMEEYRGLAVLATNRKGDLDRAFLRRLRFIVEFPRPDTAHRHLIWEQAFPPETPVGSLDYASLSRLEITGANIQNIALNAAFLAAENDDAVEMKHVIHAARREYEKIGKLVTESEFGTYYERG
ncbi:MAG: AAA family ATPase [Spirochaetes bacterium]|jgi:hypothetical protein|nr:AAA family ATPase [Spirochaetota bacterium]